MEDGLYRVDKLAIAQKNKELAGVIVSEVESKSVGNTISFIRSNYSNKRIRERISEPHFPLALEAMFTKLCGLSGVKSPITDFDKYDISNMVMRKYSDLTAEEFFKAHELERHGDYPERTPHFDLYNAEYVSKIMEKWKVWKSLAKTQHNISRPVETRIPERTDSGERQIMIDAVNRRYSQFLETESFDDPIQHIFQFLYEEKIFPEDMPYEKIYEEAKVLVEKEIAFESEETPIVNPEQMLRLEQVIKPLKEGNEGRVMTKAKKITIERFFRMMQSEEKTQIL